MLGHPRACDDETFPRFLPAGTQVAFQTGRVDAARTAGIFYGPGSPVALYVPTVENEDRRRVADIAGNRPYAEVAREVFDHFNPRADGGPPATRCRAGQAHFPRPETRGITMGFLDTLGRVLRGDPGDRGNRDVDRRRLRDSWGLDDGGSASPEFPDDAPAADPEAMAEPPATVAYDRDQWRKKLKRILEKLPESQAQWDDLIREAGGLGFDTAWVEHCQREEFALMVRRAVADGGVTLQEHHNLELARTLIGLSEDEAEATLHAIAAEAEAFFGKPVEGT